MAEHPKLVLILGDISVHAFRRAFERFPDRCFNVGVCEQTMVGAAAGFAKEGFLPVVHTIASFLVRRAYEQIYVDFGLQELAGIFVTVGAGGSYAALGPTHSCGEDIRLMDQVPGMVTEIASRPYVEKYLREAVGHRQLTYIRL